MEESLNTSRDRAKVVEITLLTTLRLSAKEGTTTVNEVWSGEEGLRLDDEELLLPSEVGPHFLSVLADGDVLEEAHTLAVHGVLGAEERSLLVDGVAVMGDEGARDPHDLVVDDHW